MRTDVCGPMRTPSFGKFLYFVTFIDDYSTHAWVYPFKEKSKVFMCFKQFVAMSENVLGCKMGTLRLDRGGRLIHLWFSVG